MLSTRNQWFIHVRLPGSHLTHWWCAFSVTLTTPAVVPAQLTAVWSLPLQGDSGGPTSISRAAPPPAVLPTPLNLLQRSWHTVVCISHDDHVAARPPAPPPVGPLVEGVVQ